MNTECYYKDLCINRKQFFDGLRELMMTKEQQGDEVAVAVINWCIEELSNNV